jgi:uncharacterized protein (DUF427 family)
MSARPSKTEPGPGQESVWDYPRPPRVEDTARHIEVIFNDVVIADSRRAKRVLETSHAPVYYLPSEDLGMEYFLRSSRTSSCEWKGRAAYFTIKVGDRAVPDAAWTYPDPLLGFESIRGYVAIYPHAMDACLVDGERASPQPGAFYGGWVTAEVVGPFKGGPGSGGW